MVRKGFFRIALAVGLSLPHTLYSQSLLKEGAPNLSTPADAGELRAPRYLPELVKQLSPGVVNISVESVAVEEAVPPEMLPFFKKDPDRPYRSVGSGFIIDPQGYVVTSNHVIEQSERIIVRLLDDKTEYPATVIGKDPKTDLALLKIEAKQQLPTVFIGDSDSIEVGEWVVAIGNQFHLGQTVTVGIVSAKSRRVPSKVGSPYDSFIQTDASINPGSSGGPLFNLKGQVIGINTAIFSPARAQMGGTGFNIGIGFAVPVNILKNIIAQLKEEGRVTRGLLGVKIQSIDDEIKRALRLPSTEGALVAEVLDKTPASAAGFKRRDVIVSFDGHSIRDFDELPLLVANTGVGKKVEIGIVRGGQAKQLQATIEEIQSEEAAVKPIAEKPNEIGVLVDEVTESTARALEMKAPTGVLVVGVQTGSVAEKAGVVKGDIIEEVGELAISGIEAFAKSVKGLPRNEPVLVTVRRKDGSRILTLRLN